MKGFVILLLLLISFMVLSVTKELDTIRDVHLLDNISNDGDSLFVKANGEERHIRLYFVDCPETSASDASMARRVREQSRYFGLTNPSQCLLFGKEATRYVKEALSSPFTIHTVYANALGRSSNGRIYVFITTTDGEDLGELLVKNGYARTKGVGRINHKQVSRDEQLARLKDFENSAMLKRVGVWSKSDAEKIAALRADQRREENELKEIQENITQEVFKNGKLNVNTATIEELQHIKGVGSVTAKRIIDNRPYSEINELLKVKGIGKKTYEKLQHKLKVH